MIDDDPVSLVLRRLAHDLKGPISSVLGNARFLLGRGDVGVEVRETLEDVVDAALAMDRQLVDLMDIQRWLAGRLAPLPSTVSLGALAARVEKGVLPLARRRGQELRVAEGLPALRARGEESLLTRAATALAESALRRSEQGAAIHLGGADAVDGVRFWVADGAPPIGAEERAAVAMPRDREGALEALLACRDRGVALARALVEACGGKLEIDDRDGGNRVSMVLARPDAR